MLNYWKFMKQWMANKKKWKAPKTVKLREHCSVTVMKNLPTTMKDMRSFTILCSSEDHTFDRALCDIGACIILMPLSLTKRLKLGQLTPTHI